MDYAAWIRRVSIFLRSLTHLRGEIDLDDGIEPPAKDDWTRDWLLSEECSLPDELRAFVATASHRCYFRYAWKPPLELRPEINALFSDRTELIGGGDLCSAAGFQNYDNRDWFLNELPVQQEETRLLLEQFVPMLTTPSADFRKEFFENSMRMSGVIDSERERGRIKLLALPNGDQISLVLGGMSATRPVVYVPSTDPGTAHVLSTSFDQFLLDWEQLCYITPTLENLAPWFDPPRGPLKPDHGQAALFREILTSASEEGRDP